MSKDFLLSVGASLLFVFIASVVGANIEDERSYWLGVLGVILAWNILIYILSQRGSKNNT